MLTPLSYDLPRRFRTIDGLRGIAALSVVAYHFELAISRSSRGWLPSWLSTVARHGYLGVDIFFVISGFVIAHSVRNGDYTGRYVARFALRRSIRLDPPYWFAIAVELSLLALIPILVGVATPFPSLPQILSHFIYAQNILGYGDILPIFWTLCYEVQFYLFFVALLVAWQAASKRFSVVARSWAALAVLSTAFIVSLFLHFSSFRLLIPGIALERWFQFFIGVMTYWVIAGRVSPVALIAVLVGLIGAVAAYQAPLIKLLPVLVSCFIVAAAVGNRLETLLGGSGFQFFGKISYSLYLLHASIGWRFISLVQRLHGATMASPLAWLLFFGATAVSALASLGLWRLLEEPSIRISKAIKLPTLADSTHSTPFSPSDVGPAQPSIRPLARFALRTPKQR